MPDITKCTGEGCTAKEQCYRFTSESSGERQSWYMEPPGKDDSCVEFLPRYEMATPAITWPPRQVEEK